MPSPPLTLAWAALAHASPVCGESLRPALPATRPSERGTVHRCCASTMPRERRRSAGHLRRQRRRRRGEHRISHFCEGPNQWERIEWLRWPAAPRSIAATTNHPDESLAQKPRVMDGAARHADLIPGLAAGGRRRASPSGTSVRVAGPRARRRPRGRTSSLLKRARRPSLRLPRSGPTAPPACCCAPTCVGERGDVLETSAFSDVVIGVRPQPETRAAARCSKLDGYRVVQAGAHADAPRGRGLGDAPGRCPGFRQVELRQPRRSTLPTTRQRPRRRPQVLQTIYSDGLTLRLGLHRAVSRRSAMRSRCLTVDRRDARRSRQRQRRLVGHGRRRRAARRR